MPTPLMAKPFYQLGLDFAKGADRDGRHRALPAGRYLSRYRQYAILGAGLYVAGGVGGTQQRV